MAPETITTMHCDNLKKFKANIAESLLKSNRKLQDEIPTMVQLFTHPFG
jgi:hypothetical protein